MDKILIWLIRTVLSSLTLVAETRNKKPFTDVSSNHPRSIIHGHFCINLPRISPSTFVGMRLTFCLELSVSEQEVSNSDVVLDSATGKSFPKDKKIFVEMFKIKKIEIKSLTKKIHKFSIIVFISILIINKL